MYTKMLLDTQTANALGTGTRGAWMDAVIDIKNNTLRL